MEREGEEKPLWSEVTIRRYGRRWFQLVLFCLVSMSNAMLWITFSPVSNLAATFYGVNSLAINCRLPLSFDRVPNVL